MVRIKTLFYLPLFLFPFLATAQFKQDGLASYYGSKFHGRRTASGEIFDKGAMTAAHKSLPFGTILKVTRVDNGDFVYVRVNDRGPFVRGRIIDLSRAAADHISMIRSGKKRVEIEVIEGVEDVTALLERQTKEPVVRPTLIAIRVGKAVKSAGSGKIPVVSARLAVIAPVLEKKTTMIPPHIPSEDNRGNTWIKNAVEALFPKKDAAI